MFKKIFGLKHSRWKCFFANREGQYVVTLDEALEKQGFREAHEAGLLGYGVKVAVIDTGIDDSHPFFKGRKIEKYSVAELPVRDGHGHGTSVSSIVLSGSPEATIVSVKALNDEGVGLLSWIVEALEIAVARKCHVINMSLGSKPNCFTPLCPIIDLLPPVVVCASGNTGPAPGTVACPAHCFSTVAVASVSARTGEIAWFSSRGRTCGLVLPDISAIGGSGDMRGVRQPIERLELPSINGTYAYARGTSFAAPWVSSAFALLIQSIGRVPSRSEQELQMKIMALDLGRPGKDETYGWGLLRADRLLRVPKYFTPKPVLEIVRKLLTIF
ncbi:S8 family serine peptidase [Candidatus Aerophobetes bacterium]|nr:S8 family serine peptidase [Candidatus Aerophobetes bacterium]